MPVLTPGFPQVDFGRDANDQQIFTLTNLEADIFCASHGAPALSLYFTFHYIHSLTTVHAEAQLLPTHMVTVRYLSENPHTPAHYARVGMYNAALWERIRPRPPPQDQAHAHAQDPDAHARALALQAQAKVFWDAQKQTQADLRWTDTDHCFHTLGSAVKVLNVHNQKYKAFLSCEGVIHRIVARGTVFLFFVHIQRNALGDAVDSNQEIADLNRGCLPFLRDDERGLLPCKITHMSRLWHLQPPPQHAHTPAKRPRLGGDGATST